MERNDNIHIIWQDAIYEDEADYTDAYRDYLSDNELTEEDCPLDTFINDENWKWLDDEMTNLGREEIPNGIFALALLGLWNGKRHSAYLADARLTAFLTMGGNGYHKHYCKGNELISEFSHHDGTNVYRWYEWRDGVTQAQQDALLGAWIRGDEEKAQKLLNLYALPLGKRVAEIYGWNRDMNYCEATIARLKRKSKRRWTEADYEAYSYARSTLDSIEAEKRYLNGEE